MRHFDDFLHHICPIIIIFEDCSAKLAILQKNCETEAVECRYGFRVIALITREQKKLTKLLFSYFSIKETFHGALIYIPIFPSVFRVYQWALKDMLS